MGSPWPFLHTEFHFEMGRQVFAVGDDGRVRELLSRHEQHKVRTYCAKVTTPSDRDLCKQLRANGDTEFVSMSWFVAEYSLTEVERRDGAARLLEANIPSLNRSYDASDLEDV